GRVEEEGPWLGSLIRQRPDEEADELYVLVEPASPGSAEYSSQLVDVISQLYAKDPLSLTGALTRSLRAAHEHLREWNRTSLKEHHVGAGASCLALRGTDAYLAQVGPSLAYVLMSDGRFRRIEAEQADFDHSLGIAEEFEPRLARIKLNPGDLVVLASTRLETVAAEAHVRRILDRGADDALPELYLLARDEPDMAVVLLSCFEQEEDLPEFLTKSGAAPSLDDASAVDAIGVYASALADAVEPLAVGVAPEGPRDAVGAAVGGFDLPRRPINEQIREIAESTAPPPTANVRIRGESANLRYKRTTGNIALPQFQIPKLWLFAAAAIAMLGALIWWQLPRSVAEGREEKFATLMADARENNATAQSTSDSGLKRQLLTDAQTMLADAEKIHDDNGELIALRSDVAAALAVLDAVYEVNDFAPIADLAQLVTGSLSVTDTVIGGGYAYLLDAEGRRVLRVPLDASSPPETILVEGEPAGFVTPARPVQIAWAEQTESLVILDEQRQAFGYFPDGGALPIAIRGADGWGSLDATAASGGNLYLLDVEGNQVWRYLPGQGGFDSERTALLDSGLGLENATELAVGQDVYVLDTVAGIRRFTGKTETPFPLAGIDQPLMSPASLSVLPGSNRIVVADRANKRIVIASAEGAFLRQIVSPSFTDLRAAYIDEGTNTIYVLNGDTLMRAAAPP
ncbi:MAG: hypothetical protein WD359_06080, partial [Dehalococcoidia bacterium]